ncbi:MAG TPA: glycoside hydrolase family 5 protein, partial [Verrucomicrobiae bacterium]
LVPLPNHRTPAYAAAAHFRHGVNAGDYLEASHPWAPINLTDLEAIQQEGFDHIRLPVAWHLHLGAAPDYLIDPAFFGQVDAVVTNTLQRGLGVMLDLHNYDDLDQAPEHPETVARLLRLWQQVAQHYQGTSGWLAFDLDNEPHARATTAVMNPIYARLIQAIREISPRRTLVVEPGEWGGIGELKHLELPMDDNLLVSVHCYEPFHFTHQGAGWVGADFQQKGVLYPGPPATPLTLDGTLQPKDYVQAWFQDYNTKPGPANPSSASAFVDKLHYVRAWSEYYGRPAYLGEFGALASVDPASRLRFYSDFRRAAERDNLGWCIWDWKANFRYWDTNKHAAMPGMHAALFGTP